MAHKTPPRDRKTGKFLSKRQIAARRAAHHGGKGTHHGSEPRAAARRPSGGKGKSKSAPRSAPRRGGGGGKAPTVNLAVVQPNAREMSRPKKKKNGGGHRGHHYGRENVIAREFRRPTVGGVVVGGAGVGLGLVGGNLIHRYSVTIDPAADPATVKLPAGVATIADYNKLAVDAKPNMKSVGLQLLGTAIGVGIGMAVPWNAAKLFFYALGGGVGLHLFGQGVDAFVLEPLFAKKPTGDRLFAHENEANAALYPPAAASGQGGLPPRDRVIDVASRRLPQNQPASRALPESLASLSGRQPGNLLRETKTVQRAQGALGQDAGGAAGGCSCGGSCSKCMTGGSGAPPVEAVAEIVRDRAATSPAASQDLGRNPIFRRLTGMPKSSIAA